MKESVLDEALFRHSFLVAVLLGTLCRLLVLRISDRQYPTRPQDYIAVSYTHLDVYKRQVLVI